MVQTHGAGAGPNGNLLDAAGRLVTFRQGPAARDVVRQPPPDAGRTAEVRGVGDGKRIGEVALPAVEVLAARYEGRRLNGPNDGAVHPDGSIFFTDPNWGLVLANATASQELDVHGVYRLDATTNATAAPLRLVLEGLAMPNGVAVADDGATLFVSDTGGRGDHPVEALRESPPAVRAFRLAPDGGLADAAPLWEAGLFSDGMCLDGAGLWTTGPEGLVLLDPADGSERWRVELPEPPTNVECRTEGAAAADGAGAGARVLFATAPTRVFRVTYADAEEEGGR